MSKSVVRQAVLDALAQERDLQARAALMAREEATSEESKAENKYDTRGQEAAYLAESQAKLAQELQDSIVLYQQLPLPDFSPHDAIQIGALIQLKHQGRSQWCLLGPRNGGLEFSVEGKTVVVLTPQSPLGQRLLGKRPGESVTLPGRTGPLVHEIVSIS